MNGGTDYGRASSATIRRSLTAIGILVMFLGVVAIVSPIITEISLSILLGILLLIGGISQFIHVFSNRTWTGAVWQLLLSGVYTVAGTILVVHPLFALTTLTVVLAAFFVVEGFVEVIISIQLHPRAGWGWALLSGVPGVLIGALIWLGWPNTTIWAIGLLFGINLLSTGISMVMIAQGGRSKEHKEISSNSRARDA